MFSRQFVRNHLGEEFKIHSSKEGAAPRALKSMGFHSGLQASQFINSLVVPVNFWRNFYSAESQANISRVNEMQLCNEIAKLLCRGQVRVYKIDNPLNSSQPEKRTVTDSNRNRHTFIPASSLLVNHPREVLLLTNEAATRLFIEQLNPSPDQLARIAEELKLPVSVDEKPKELIVNALTMGDIVVTIDRYSSPQKPQVESDATVVCDKNPGLGPATERAVVSNDEVSEVVPDRTPLIKSESGGTLIFHENLDGHTIRRHVGKTDDQLLQRFDTEPDILGSSSYPDIETAQRAVGDVLSRNRDGVQDWLTNSPKPRLTLNETLDFEVGRVIPQGATVSQSSNKSFVLLVKDPLAPNGYRVHTSFPKPND